MFLVDFISAISTNRKYALIFKISRGKKFQSTNVKTEYTAGKKVYTSKENVWLI